MHRLIVAAQTETDPKTKADEPLHWEFGNLLDADAQSEVREFYGALEKSKDCDTVLVGYTPPRD